VARRELAVIPGGLRELPRTSHSQEKLLSLKAAAAILGISSHTLRKYIARGEIPRVKLRRRVLIDPEDLRSFVERHKETRGSFPGG